MIVEGWDGLNPTDYMCPVQVGDLILLRKGRTVIVSDVTQTEGFMPDVVELAEDIRVDLTGFDLEVLYRDGGEPPRQRRYMTTGHLARVADTYRAALAVGQSPTKAVAVELHTSHSSAGRWVTRARAAGLLGPAIGPKAGEARRGD